MEIVNRDTTPCRDESNEPGSVPSSRPLGHLFRELPSILNRKSPNRKARMCHAAIQRVGTNIATHNTARHSRNQNLTPRREDAKKSRIKLLAPWRRGVLR
jgi:hypothetical protein